MSKEQIIIPLNMPEQPKTKDLVKEVISNPVISEENNQSEIELKKQKEEEHNKQIETAKQNVLKHYEGENKIKEGVDFVFTQNPELEKIGTKEKYSEYLENIFPDSKVKDIVYHYTAFKDKIIKDGFKSISELGEITGAGDIDAIFLTKSSISYWGGEKSKLDKVAAIVNSENALDLSHLSKKVDVDDLSEKDLIIYKKYTEILDLGYDRAWKKYKDPTKIQIAEERKNEFINQGYDSILHPELYEIAVFNKAQTHVLGSNKDVDKFKEFASKNKEK